MSPSDRDERNESLSPIDATVNENVQGYGREQATSHLALSEDTLAALHAGLLEMERHHHHTMTALEEFKTTIADSENAQRKFEVAIANFNDAELTVIRVHIDELESCKQDVETAQRELKSASIRNELAQREYAMCNAAQIPREFSHDDKQRLRELYRNVCRGQERLRQLGTDLPLPGMEALAHDYGLALDGEEIDEEV